ncbi:unnamed protein product [Scytosiphon promiscuus]
MRKPLATRVQRQREPATLARRRRTSRRRCRLDMAREGKMLMSSITLLVLGVCARAMAVAGAVMSPTAAAATTAVGRGGAVAAGVAATVVSSSTTAAATGKSFAASVPGEQRVQPAAGTFVSSSARRGRRSLCHRDSAALGRPTRTAAVLREVSPGAARRAGRFHRSRTPRSATPAFALPLAPTSAVYSYHYSRQQRQAIAGGGGGGGVRLSGRCSRISPPRDPTFNGIVASAVRAGVALPSRKRPLSMGAAAAAVAAAEAMASIAGRVSSLPRPLGCGGGSGGGGDGVSLRSRPSLMGLRALAAGNNEPDGSGESDRTKDGSGNGADVESPGGALQVLLSVLRWVLTGGWLGLKRQEQKAADAALASRREASHAFFQLFQWMWWPFAGLEGGLVDGNRRDARESGMRARNGRRPRAKRAGTPEQQQQQQQQQRAMLRPTTTKPGSYPRPQSTAYPRPQSTAYPRPQSTAYPRPRVKARTLLDLDVEESEALPPRKQRLATAAAAAAGNRAGDPEAVTKDPLWSRFLMWFFERAITSRAKLVEGLEVSVDARSNREAMSGLLQSVGITFNHLELENLEISGGARMEITGLDLKVMTLLWKRFGSFKKPFEVEGSYVLTSGDLAASSMVRRLVSNMMNSTLRKLESLATEPLRNSSITIKQVTAKRSRLVIEGEMAYDTAKVPFTYRTSIGVKGQGHVVYLKDAEVFWENIGGSLSLPLLPLETFDVDMGEGARIESIRIVNGQVALKARVVISPFPPLMVASLPKRAAFRYDVAERISVTFGNLVENIKILRLQLRPNRF